MCVYGHICEGDAGWGCDSHGGCQYGPNNHGCKHKQITIIVAGNDTYFDTELDMVFGVSF